MLFKHPNRGPRRAALVAAAALAAGALAAAPGAAHAGTYPMYSCNVPGHRTFTRGPWTINPSLNGGNTRLGALDQCASGGWFGVGKGAVGMDPNSMAGVGLSVPVGYSISQLKSYPLADLPGTGSPASVGNEIGGFDFLLWSSPATIDRTGPTNPYVQAVDAGTNSFWWTLFCGADAGQRCDLFSATPLVLQGIETTVSESAAPAAGIDGGTLTTAGAKKGTKTVAVTGTDALSGVKKLEVLLDDTVLGTVDYSNDWTKTLAAQKPGTCAFADWHACPTTQSTTFSVDTTRVVDGAYALSVRATDAAGNVRTTTAPQKSVHQKLLVPASTVCTYGFVLRSIVAGELQSRKSNPPISFPTDAGEPVPGRSASGYDLSWLML